MKFPSSISTSQDPLMEISWIFTDEEYCKNQRIHPSSVGLLLKAKYSISTISSKSLSSHCRKEHRERTIEKYDKRLRELTAKQDLGSCRTGRFQPGVEENPAKPPSWTIIISP